MDFQAAIINGVNTLRVGTNDIGTLYTYEYENGSPKSFRDNSGKVVARTYQSMKKKLGIQNESHLASKFSQAFNIHFTY
jgi:hypothetical protein